MAVELSLAKDSLKTTAEELGITPQILTRWRRERLSTQKVNTSGRVGSSQEQQEILRLKKELKQAELDRIAEATRYIPAVSIFSRNDRAADRGTFFNS